LDLAGSRGREEAEREEVMKVFLIKPCLCVFLLIACREGKNMKEEKKTAQVETKEANNISDSGSAKTEAEPPQIVYKEMADAAPEPLLYGFRTERGGLSTERWPNSWRILQNGEIWYCWNWAYIPVNGKYVYHGPNRPETKPVIRLPRIWRHWGEVATPEEIDKIREFVRKNKVLELPDEVRGEGGCIGGTNVFFTVEVDGKRRTILWTQCGDQPPEPIRSLEELAIVIRFEASRRWGEKYRALIEE
jgi:hypothetical protein